MLSDVLQHGRFRALARYVMITLSITPEVNSSPASTTTTTSPMATITSATVKRHRSEQRKVLAPPPPLALLRKVSSGVPSELGVCFLKSQTAYDANAVNQYSAINSFVPEFDLDGNKTKTGIWTVAYNAENRPVSFISEDGSSVIESVYDYMGRRAWKKVTKNGTITKHERYLYRGYLQIATIDLMRSQLPTLNFLIWDPTEPQATRPLALQAYATWYSYGFDLTKNVKELFNTAGNAETIYDYLPFGEVSVSGNHISPLQWSAEVYDKELGLVYYNYRHYNPADG